MKNLKFISEKTREQLDIKRSLFQEEYVNDFRPSAGASAVKSGALFEQVVQEKIQGLMGNKSFKLFSQPSFTDYMDMDRRADFMLLTKEHKSDQPLYIECKQLGNCESHIDKVVVWFNQIFFSTNLLYPATVIEATWHARTQMAFALANQFFGCFITMRSWFDG